MNFAEDNDYPSPRVHEAEYEILVKQLQLKIRGTCVTYLLNFEHFLKREATSSGKITKYDAKRFK
jgi:hypothetical protein